MNVSSSLGQRLPDLCEPQRDQRQQRDLRRERLRRGDTDLEAAARVQDRVGLARDLRPHQVRDRERPRALLLRELHRVDRVARLTRLRDADHERVLREHRVAVDPLARDVGLDREARPLLDDVAADDAGVVRGAARDDHDAAQVLDLEIGQADALEEELAVARAVADRLAHRLGLLVDLLEHERLVAALLGRLVVPVDLDHVGLDDLAAAVEDRALGRDRDDVAVVDQLHAARLREEGCDRRREEHLALADADDERRLVARADEQVGMVVVDHDEREVTLELGVGLAALRATRSPS